MNAGRPTDPVGFADGWQGAVDEVRRHALDPDAHCLSCILDRVAFTGIVAALDTGDPATIDEAMTTGAAEHLLRLALADDLDVRAGVVTAARTIVRETPAVAGEVLVRYALVLGRHYTFGVDEDGTVSRVVSADGF